MLNYKLVGDNDYIFDPIGTIFANRGIEDVDRFMNLDKSVVHHFYLLKNIDKAVNCLLKHIERQSRMMIVVDPDVDGFSSSAIMYQYIKLIDENAKLKWVLHDDKKHGLDGIDIPKGIDLVIIPDSGSEDYKAHKELSDQGIDIIVLDHHEAETESEYAIIVNPKLCNYPNLNLSGAGVVIKFCEALDKNLGLDYSPSFYDLVALGNIADSMLMTELETRYYVQEGLKEVNNDFFNALISKQEYSMGGKVNITGVNFYISPLINSVIRVSNLSEKIDMFKAFIGEKELVKYKPRGSDETLVPLVSDVARRCANARAKQNRIRDKIVQEIEDIIVRDGLYKNKVIFVTGVKFEQRELTGLVCNVIASKYKRPVIIISGIDKSGFGKGSGRGYDKGSIEDFKAIVLETGLFEYARGHAGAFGVSVHKDNFHKVNDKLNQLLEGHEISDKYIVDFSIKSSLLKPDLIEEIDSLSDVWGKGCEEPYIHINDIPIAESDMSLIGKKEDTISILYNNIKFMIFKSSQEVFKEIENSKTLSLIGKAKMNVYKDVATPQIQVSRFELN